MIRVCIVVLCAFLTSCCSKTTLVLLPDDDGSTGEVVMQTDGGELALDTPYAYTEVQSSSSVPKEKKMEEEKFTKKWGNLAEKEAVEPQSFILNFHLGSTKLTTQSVALFPEVIAAISQDEPVEVDIIGHSDAVGDQNYNYRLSLRRAKTVHAMLMDKAPWIERVKIESFGENDPLIPTADNVPEPRNRRVEILIR